MRDEYLSVISITWEGSYMPNEIRIYGGITSLRVRPFIDNVLQCFACYRFGHMARHCRRTPICMACGEKFHGHCNRDWRCINCGGRHKPTDRRCDVYKYNQEVKRVMAEACVSVYEAKERLASNHIIERDEWKRLDDRPRFGEISTFSGRVFGGGSGQGNQRVAEKEQNLIDLDEGQVSETKRVTYAEAVGGKQFNKNIDFPSLSSQDRLSDRHSRFSQVLSDLENEEVNLTEQKEDRNGRSMSRRREQIIGEIAEKLREELRVDVLRIIREEVRENLRIIIGDSIREEVIAILQERGGGHLLSGRRFVYLLMKI